MPALDCIFCRIVSGDIPALRVLDAPDALAFLDVGPLAPGHCLLIPKTHYESLLDIPAERIADLMCHLPVLAQAVMESVDATGLNLLQNTGASSGQAVTHLHFHLIPRIDGDRLGYRWNAGAYEAGEGDRIQARIRGALGRQ